MRRYAITKLSKEKFPFRLAEIPDPPETLFLAGTLPPEDKKHLCVVGARKYTEYGKEACEKLIAGLRGHPVAIVSGLALGIDSIAHRAALAADLQTIAVPGSGLDPEALYPASHRALAEKILERGGALLSEFEPAVRAAPWTFPRRNRIMAGLSDAVLVIEAERRSGTLITSKLATEYNRDVLAVPGSIFSKTSEGPHLLLRLGAAPAERAADILEALGLSEQAAGAADSPSPSDCSPEELAVLALLASPLTREELFAKLRMPIANANALLSVLELKGLIVERLGEVRRA